LYTIYWYVSFGGLEDSSGKRVRVDKEAKEGAKVVKDAVSKTVKKPDEAQDESDRLEELNDSQHPPGWQWAPRDPGNYYRIYSWFAYFFGCLL
jgi:hypothetical protein